MADQSWGAGGCGSVGCGGAAGSATGAAGAAGSAGSLSGSIWLARSSSASACLAASARCLASSSC
ncbi:MAG: hypothetical protein FJ076_03735 [Cyanobacteria bacterium K_DeepCast_35m_m1_288]|nr:hypothetical protein [Cyanobacteria bacterium K_DeepCast_35m_m1_288]